MTDRPDYASLIERLEKAEGPDRELDAAIEALFYTLENDAPAEIVCDSDCAATGQYWVKIDGGRSLYAADPLTKSLDAALSLVERVLPGWGIEVLTPDRDMWRAQVWRWRSETNDERGQWTPCYARPPALALLLSLLKAKQAQE